MTQRNGSAAGLTVVHLPLNEESLDTIFGQLICGTGTCRTSSNHSHAKLATLREVDTSTNHDLTEGRDQAVGVMQSKAP